MQTHTHKTLHRKQSLNLATAVGNNQLLLVTLATVVDDKSSSSGDLEHRTNRGNFDFRICYSLTLFKTHHSTLSIKCIHVHIRQYKAYFMVFIPPYVPVR